MEQKSHHIGRRTASEIEVKPRLCDAAADVVANLGCRCEAVLVVAGPGVFKVALLARDGEEGTVEGHQSGDAACELLDLFPYVEEEGV